MKNFRFNLIVVLFAIAFIISACSNSSEPEEKKIIKNKYGAIISNLHPNDYIPFNKNNKWNYKSNTQGYTDIYEGIISGNSITNKNSESLIELNFEGMRLWYNVSDMGRVKGELHLQDLSSNVSYSDYKINLLGNLEPSLSSNNPNLKYIKSEKVYAASNTYDCDLFEFKRTEYAFSNYHTQIFQIWFSKGVGIIKTIFWSENYVGDKIELELSSYELK